MKIREIYPIWREDKRHFVKRSTMSAYTLLFENHILPHFGDFESIIEDDVQDFVFRKLESEISKKTISDILITLKMILKFGQKKGLIEFVPWEIRYPTSAYEDKRIQVLTPAEHRKIMEYIMNNMTLRNLGILLCLQGGFRIGEICAMQWSDIDIDRKIITVNKTIQRIYENNLDDECCDSEQLIKKGKTTLIIDTPKTKNSRREVPIASKTFQILKKMASFSNPDYFILTNEAKPTEPRTYRSYYKSFMKQLGMPQLNFHGLRHSFATRCIESKTDVKTVSEILGHSNVSTTLNLYVHPTLTQKKNTIDSVMKNIKL